jgi:tetratricopeptide (TPR) repeat protein
MPTPSADDADAHARQGHRMQGLGRWDEALAAYDRALASRPAWVAIQVHRAMVLERLARPQEALLGYDAAVSLRADDWQIRVLRANLRVRLGHLVAALADFDRALVLRPDFAEGHSNRGNTLVELGLLVEALAAHDRAVALAPDSAAIHFNRGNGLRELGQVEAAMASYARALTLDPRHVEAHSNLGVLLAGENRHAEALACYENALRIRPDHPQARYNRALAYLATGELARGWRDYEARWLGVDGMSREAPREFREPLWLGETPAQGRAILVHAEQGLGDTLQFSRYVEQLAAAGAAVTFEVQAPLRALLQQLRGDVRVITRGEAYAPCDCRCPLLSLPLALRTTLATIPARPRYLEADAVKRQHWRGVLRELRTPRIGLVWRGSRDHRNDVQRSARLSEWLSRLPPGFAYVSLQKDVRDEDADVLTAHPELFDPAGQLQDFADTAALCECLDLVISVDTSVAHLSGALGCKTWVLLPFHADWRWMLERGDSPWYPTMRLYRQTTRGDWAGVLERVSRDLAIEFPAEGARADA